MGCRKKMWLCLSLWFTLVYMHCVDSRHVPESSANELSKQRESENINYFNNLILTGLSNSETTRDHTKFNPPVRDTEEMSKSRLGYEKDLMVVLPVMPKNVGDGSNLQMWYTQVPVTAIIEDHTQPNAQKRADYDVYENPNMEERHPYTKFLVNKATSKPQKSPLDYGYPDSFKFVEDMNGLPSNHKPEWANTDITDLDESSKSTTEHLPDSNNPFEMFESVKPLEINKLLAPQSILVSSEVEDIVEKKNGTQSNVKPIPKRPVKRPTKKPQKVKPTTESEHDATSTTANSVMGVDQLYSAARFTTLLESNKEFLPTLHPYKNKLPIPVETTSVPTTTEAATTTLRPTTSSTTIYSTSSTTVRTTTTTEPTTTSTTTARPSSTTTTTTSAPSIGEIVVYNVTEDADDEEFQSPDNFTTFENTDFQVHDFEPPKNLNSGKLDIKESDPEPFKEHSPTLSGDMLTSDMKNMLISLGILNSDGTAITITSTTEQIFVRKEPVTPSIDPNSYTSFKKIPTDYKHQNEKSGISDDMKDLLASFGLLPKKPSENDNPVTRISRQQNLDKLNSTKELTSEEADLLDFFSDHNSSKNALEINSAMLSDEMKSTLENMGLLKELSRSPKSGHVFQPASHLEKLTKEQNVKKINDVIKTIKSLSIKTESNDLSAEEIEKQLANITVTLNDENVTDTSDTLLFELNEVLTNDTKVKLIDSIENTTNKINATASQISDDQPATRINYLDTTIPNFFSTTVNKSIESSPNPLSTEELLQLYEMGKNEIKRQQPNDTQVISTTSSPETTLSSIEDIPGANTEAFPISSETPSNTTSPQPSSSTEINTSSEMATDTKVAENNNAPIADLADSFGGGGVASEEPSMDDLPTPKPNGLYFYLDWNTFLNVGEEDKNPIRIRFAPRAGNPRNFLPVTVP